ncbi:MAG: NlpC/P60 family protein [Actinocatenispora sp.]
MSVARVMSRPRRALVLVAAAACVTVGSAMVGPGAYADPSTPKLEHQMDSTWTKLEATGERYKQNEAKLHQNEAKSKKLGKQIKPLAKKVNGMYEQVGKYAAAAYKGGTASAFNSMLKYGSASSMLDQISTLDRMASDQHRKVRKYELAKNKLDAEKNKYDGLIKSNKTQKVKLAAEKKHLQSSMDQMQAKYMQTAASRTNSGTALPAHMPYIPGAAGVAVRFAIDQIGKPYVWNTAGPSTYDCSGLTMASWGQAGVSMAHYTYDQFSAFPHVSESELQPGDLVFWNGGEHVGIYIGQGLVIHAPTPGESVKVSPTDYPGSWYGAVRP